MAAQKEKKIEITDDTDVVDETKSEDEEVDQNQKDETASDEETESGPDKEEDLATQLEKSKQESKDHYDRFLRVTAEFDNYKKRSIREMGEFRKYANEAIIKDLLPILDNLERAIDSATEDKQANNSVVEGVEMTLKEILRVFEKFEVKTVDALEKPFDPCFHQAMMKEETDAFPENTVIKVLQKGYTMHDRLIRPAMVSVSAAIQKNEETSEEDQKN